MDIHILIQELDNVAQKILDAAEFNCYNPVITYNVRKREVKIAGQFLRIIKEPKL